MIGIVLTFILALVGLTFLIALSLRRDEVSREASSRKQGRIPVAGLSVAFLPIDILIGIDDYRRLKTRPELRAVGKMFWRDRRRILLMRLRELWKDVYTLWKFRRFLVRNGLRVTFQEEVAVIFAALLALQLLIAVRAGVFTLGPFALRKGLKIAESLVEWLSRFVVAPLAHVPGPRRTEIERGWNQELLAMGAKAS